MPVSDDARIPAELPVLGTVEDGGGSGAQKASEDPRVAEAEEPAAILVDSRLFLDLPQDPTLLDWLSSYPKIREKLLLYGNCFLRVGPIQSPYGASPIKELGARDPGFRGNISRSSTELLGTLW